MPGTHIIRRQFLDVELVGAESDGVALQRRLMHLCQDRLMPALERVLDRALPADEHWTLDRLEIDAGAFDLESLEGELVDQVSQTIERQLKERVFRAGPRTARGRRPVGAAGGGFAEDAGTGLTDSSEERRTEARAVEDAFVHFLRTGLLPWWFSLPPGTSLEAAVRASWATAAHGAAGIGAALAAVLASAPARTRLVRQFSAEFLTLLLGRVSEARLAAVREILAELETHERAAAARDALRALVWQAAFAPGDRRTVGALVAAALDEAPAAEIERMAPALLDAIGRVWPEARADRIAETALRRILEPDAAAPRRADRAEADARLALEEGVFIGCAGIVLLHPFLPRLFEGLGIAADDALVAPDRALGLLHFLATGQSMAPEYELLLPKILCNVPLDLPVGAPAELTAAEMDEANALLSAVVGHWTALGDTSVDGLRGSFLARPGKLSRRGETEDLLQVEPRSYDILLDRLPWGIGMVQLPWMKRILWVEWRF